MKPSYSQKKKKKRIWNLLIHNCFSKRTLGEVLKGKEKKEKEKR